MIRARIGKGRAAGRGDDAPGQSVQGRQRILGSGGMVRGMFAGMGDGQKAKSEARTEEDGKFRYDHRDYEAQPKVAGRRDLDQRQDPRRDDMRDGPHDDRRFQRDDRRDFVGGDMNRAGSDYDDRRYQTQVQRDGRRSVQYSESDYGDNRSQRGDRRDDRRDGGRGFNQAGSVQGWEDEQQSRAYDPQTYGGDDRRQVDQRPAVGLRRVEPRQDHRYGSPGYDARAIDGPPSYHE